MSKSIRFVRRGIRGRVPQNFNWPGVIRSRQAVVHITAAEVVPGNVSVVGGVEQTFRYNLGAANVWVSNVSPHFAEHAGDPGGVEFIINVDWPSPIDVGVTITVEDATPVEIQN